jgi:hypothetical protein
MLTNQKDLNGIKPKYQNQNGYAEIFKLSKS